MFYRHVTDRDDTERLDLRSVPMVIQREPGVSRQLYRGPRLRNGIAPLRAQQADQTTGHTVAREAPRNIMIGRVVRTIVDRRSLTGGSCPRAWWLKIRKRRSDEINRRNNRPTTVLMPPIPTGAFGPADADPAETPTWSKELMRIDALDRPWSHRVVNNDFGGESQPGDLITRERQTTKEHNVREPAE